MRRFIAILIGCSLVLAAGVRAEQENPNNPKKKKSAQQTTAVQKQVTTKQHAAPNTHGQGVNPHHNATTVPNNAKVYNGNVSKQQYHKVPAVQTPSNELPAVQATKVHKVQKNNLSVGQPNELPAVQANKIHAGHPNKVPGVQSNKYAGQSYHSQHIDFHAKPNPAIASATYNQHYRIKGSQHWQGNHYAAFRTYHPQWHNRNWWHSHHNHIVLIGGGWYFWNAGYWYPAWGYDSAAAYYPYDGPIYSGQNVTPLDQVIADVQAALQEQGYYQGEVDGLLGPLTQEALAAYQAAQGLDQTAAIDQPTLESLGLG